MMEWWNDIRMLCHKYLVASEAVERTGPVHEAVRSVGYLSGEELESEEEGVAGDERDRRLVAPPAAAAAAADDERAEGSSVEEEPDVEPTYDHPPVYTHPEKQYTGLEIGPHGYAVRPFVSFFFLTLSDIISTVA